LPGDAVDGVHLPMHGRNTVKCGGWA